MDSLDDKLKSLLAKTPRRRLSGIVELSGSFTRSGNFGGSFNRSTGSLGGSSQSPGAMMIEWVLVEELQNALEKLTTRCKRGRKCCERVLICFKVAQVSLSRRHSIS